VTGRAESIMKLQNQLDCMSGPRKQIPRAMWAELMRTRMMDDIVTDVHIMVVQRDTGCRVHIERDHFEVRLFGTREEQAKATIQLETLVDRCVEEVVTIFGASPFTSPTLQQLAFEHEVVLVPESNRILVLGQQEAAERAAADLQMYLDGEKQVLPGQGPQLDDSRSHQMDNRSPAFGLQPAKNTTDPDKPFPIMYLPATDKVPAPPARIATPQNFVAASGKSSKPSAQFNRNQTGLRACGKYCAACLKARFCIACGAPLGGALPHGEPALHVSCRHGFAHQPDPSNFGGPQGFNQNGASCRGVQDFGQNLAENQAHQQQQAMNAVMFVPCMPSMMMMQQQCTESTYGGQAVYMMPANSAWMMATSMGSLPEASTYATPSTGSLPSPHDGWQQTSSSSSSVEEANM